MMKEIEMISLIDNQLKNYNLRNLDHFCSNFHDEVQVESFFSKKTINGITEFRERYKLLFEGSPNLHCELKHRIVLNHCVIDEEMVTGAAAFPAGLHTVAIYGFRDGLIDRVWFPR